MDLFDAFSKTEPPAPTRSRSEKSAALTRGYHTGSHWETQLPSPGELLDGLNQQQAEAVVYEGGPLLIMAGAGSGKTRVLTHRIAYLLATGRASAGQILAITFTNKAAAEMRERVGALVGSASRRMWVSTFHSACVRILRENYAAAGLKSTFSIYDQQDSQRLLGMILRSQDVDVKKFSPRLIAARISDLKNELTTPGQYVEQMQTDPVSEIVAAAYPEYQKRLRQANAVDFDDLIMLTVQLLHTHPAIAEFYQRRFRHILVDEYQDTNHAQYELVRALVGEGQQQIPRGELTVVGDSDQSIYAFRGASIRNIEEFEQDFPDAHVILLEQNYRSTQNILAAANAVIKQNSGRRPKNLWTAAGDGAKITIDAADSEHDEARLVVREIDDLSNAGVNLGDIAVFYRTNAQSRVLEELLMRMSIPYRIVGGTRFYERQEVKDALAYLQVIINPDDTVAMRRIINTPRRGVGAVAEAALLNHADRYGVSFGAALADTVPDSERPVEGLAVRPMKAIGELWLMLAELREAAEDGAPAAQLLDEVLARSGYLDALKASEDPQDASRVDNLAELLSVAEDFDSTRQARLEAGEAEEEEGTPATVLGEFLERVALVADADQIPADDERGGQVTLMTVHTAKGLEFPYVFVTGMEDGTFPHRRSMEDPSELAEERRLAYVAITRARERLYLTRAASRSAWGMPEEMAPSRFLDNLPEETVELRHKSTRDQLMGRSAQRSLLRGDDGGRVFGSGVPGSLQRSFGGDGGGTARPGGVHRLGTRLGESKDKPVLQLKVGDRVKHGTLGEGTVVGVEGSGRQSVAIIDFSGTRKRLLLRMAPLKKL